jgi:hypothetical protein
MDNRPAGFSLRDIDCVPHGLPEGRRFYALPGKPQVELDADGEPRAFLMESPGSAQVVVQAVWTVEEADLEALRVEIRRRHPDIGEFTLEVAPLADVSASLVVTGKGGEKTFGPVPALGGAPQRVSFMESVADACAADAAEAFQRRRGHIAIRYSGQLRLEEEVRVTIQGDLAEDIKALAPEKPKSTGWSLFGPKEPPPPPPPPDRQKCLEQIGLAIAAGRLKVLPQATTNASPALRARVEEAAREKAADDLARTLKQRGADASDTSRFDVKYQSTDTESNTYEITGVLDLGEWLGARASP